MNFGKKTCALLLVPLVCLSQGSFAQSNIEFVIFSSWDDNYCGEIKITSDVTLSDWHVTATVDGVINNVWNGTYRQVDNNPAYNAIFEPLEWNNPIPAGGTGSIGLCGSGEPPEFNGGETDGNDSGSNPVSLTVTELAAGYYSGTDKKRYIVAHTQEDLRQIETLLGHELTVDISRYTVIGAFMGQRPTGGHDIQVVHAFDTANSVKMLVNLSEPGPTCMAIQVLTSPYQVVAIPKTDKVIDITEQKTVQQCV